MKCIPCCFPPSRNLPAKTWRAQLNGHPSRKTLGHAGATILERELFLLSRTLGMQSSRAPATSNGSDACDMR